MSDTVGGLGFTIDTSSLVNATTQLDTFQASSDKVRASNEFMVRSLSNSSAAFAELATNGRASLMSFVAIAQNLDMVTDKLTALRAAAAGTSDVFKSGVLTAANTDVQREFSTMATIFGTTAGQLELYNKQASYLGMNSQQVASSIQRISEAMRDQTAAGAAMRQVLVGAGVNMNQSADQILAQFIQNERGRKDDATRYTEMQSELGPMNPSLYQQLGQPNYIPVREQQGLKDQLQATAITGPQDESNAIINRRLDQNDAQFADLRSLYGSQVSLNMDLYKFLQPSTASGRELAGELKRDGGSSSELGSLDIMKMMQQHQDQLGILSYTPSAVGYGIEHGALGHDLSIDLPRGDRRPARGDVNSMIGDQPHQSFNPGESFGNWMRFRYGDENSRYISNQNTIAVDERDEEQRATGWDRFVGGPENRALNRRFRNEFGLYTPPPNEVQGGKVVASEAYLDDSATANQMAQFGDTSLQQRLSAQAMVGIDGNAGQLDDPIIRTRMAAIYGNKEADQRIAQMRGIANYTVANVTSPGFDQLQTLQDEQYVPSQAPQQVAEARQLLGYGQQLGLNTGDWQKRHLTDQDIIGGKGPAGDVLTDRQRESFTAIEGGNAALVSGQSAQTTATNIEEQKALQAAVAGGAGAVQEATAVWEAYQAALAKTSDPAALARVRTDAQKSWLASQQTSFQTQQNELDRATADLQKEIEGGNIAIGQGPGALGAQQSEMAIRQQMDQFRRSAEGRAAGPIGAAEREKTLRDQQQDNLIIGAQSDLAGAQVSAAGGTNRLAATLSGGGSHEENVLQTNIDYATQLATSTGKTRDALEQTINSIVSFKDRLDETNQAMTDLQTGLQAETTAAANRAEMTAPPGQRDEVRARYMATTQVQQVTSPLAGAGPNPLADLAPGQGGAVHPPAVLVPPSPASDVVAPTPMTVTPNPAAPAAPASPTGPDLGGVLSKIDSALSSVFAPAAPAAAPTPPAPAAPPAAFPPPLAAPASYPDTSTTQGKAEVLESPDPMSMLTPAARAAMRPYDAIYARAAGGNAQVRSFAEAQGFLESSGQPGAANTAPGTHAVGMGQFEPETARRLGLYGDGFDYRSDPTKAIPAQVKYDEQLMGGGSWGSSADKIRVGQSYGTLPSKGAVLGDGQFAGDATDEATVTGQQVQAQTMGYALGDERSRFSASIGYLASGQTGRASLAEAGVVGQTVPDPMKAVTAAQQLEAAQEQLTKSIVGLDSQIQISTDSATAMAAAYNKGPQAVAETQALLDAQASARQNAQDPDANSDYVRRETAANLKKTGEDQTSALNQQNESARNSNDLRAQELNNATIADPLARAIADAVAQANEQNKMSPDASNDAKAANVEFAKAAAQLDVVAQKQSDVAAGAGQIGDAVSGTLSNMAFSYQRGPGAGRYIQQQAAGLLNSGAHSLFDISVGDPLSRWVASNFASAANSIMGNTTGGAVGPSSNDQGGTGGGGSGVSGAIGSTLMNSALGQIGGGILGGLFGSSPESTATSVLGAHQGVGGSAGLFSTIANLFALGGAVSKGSTIAFGDGGMFDDGPQTVPMALLGEAGPEAVMPLHRGPDGRLGVVNHGQGGSGGASITVMAPIKITGGQMGSNGKLDARSAAALHQQVTDMFKSAAKSVMGDEARPGGMLYK